MLREVHARPYGGDFAPRPSIVCGIQFTAAQVGALGRSASPTLSPTKRSRRTSHVRRTVP